MKKIFKLIGVLSLVLAVLAVSFSGSFVEAATYTPADVAAHSTATDCWVIINNNVYNLTSFIPSHSGGSNVILGVCGKDGTAIFNSGPHSSTTINAISSLLLGTIKTAPTTIDPVPNSVTPTPYPVPILTHHTDDEDGQSIDEDSSSEEDSHSENINKDNSKNTSEHVDQNHEENED